MNRGEIQIKQKEIRRRAKYGRESVHYKTSMRVIVCMNDREVPNIHYADGYILLMNVRFECRAEWRYRVTNNQSLVTSHIKTTSAMSPDSILTSMLAMKKKDYGANAASGESSNIENKICSNPGSSHFHHFRGSKFFKFFQINSTLRSLNSSIITKVSVFCSSLSLARQTFTCRPLIAPIKNEAGGGRRRLKSKEKKGGRVWCNWIMVFWNVLSTFTFLLDVFNKIYYTLGWRPKQTNTIRKKRGRSYFKWSGKW